MKQPTDYGEEMAQDRVKITTTSGKMYSEEEVEELKQQAFLDGHLDCQKAGSIDNHAAYKETKQALLREVLEHRKVVKDDDNAEKQDWFEAVPVEAIQALMEGKK